MPEQTDSKPESNNGEMSFLDHLEEMRGVILKSLSVFMLAFLIVVCGFYYFNKLMLFPLNKAKDILATYCGQEQVQTPAAEQKIGPVYLVEDKPDAEAKKIGPYYVIPKDDTVVLVKNAPSQSGWIADIKLRSMSITTPIFVWLSVGFLGSLGLSLPFVLFFAARFIMPGLKPNELKMLAPGMIVGLILFFVGSVFAFTFMLPMGIAFMAYMSQGMQLEMFPDAMSYYSMVICVTIAVGFTFELPLLEFILVYLGVVSVDWLKKNRRIVILIIVLFAAIVTPPDFITQIALATPLYLMYEISLRIGIIMRRKKLAKEAEEEAAAQAEEEREHKEFVREEAQRRLAEEREEEEERKRLESSEGAESGYKPTEDRAYDELDNLDDEYNLDDDYGLDAYMEQLDSEQPEGYINYGKRNKYVMDFSPRWELNAPDTSFMAPDWNLNTAGNKSDNVSEKETNA